MAPTFREALASGRFLVTAEIGPPKGTNLEKAARHIDLLKDKVDALNVTDNQSSVMRFPSLGGCLLIKEQGGEPILQLTCRDRNRLALQADLLFAHSRGIRNVLCLTGDFITVGDHKEAKAVFDLDSVQLLRTVRLLESGKDLGGNDLDLDGAMEFCAGAVVTPGALPLEPQLIKFEKKVEAGAEFFQTQAVYDPRKFAEFMDRVKGFSVPILAGIVPLRSAGMARFMNKNVPGIQVPEPLIEEMDRAEDRVKTSVEIAARLIKETKDLCQGVHIMAIGREEIVPDILEAAGLG